MFNSHLNFKSRAKKLGDGEFMESLVSNIDIYNFYFDSLCQIAITSCKWVNLPETIDERFLEKTLFEKGAAVFFFDDVLGYTALPVILEGEPNQYNIPRNRVGYTYNAQIELTDKNSVVIFNNVLRQPSSYMVKIFATKLYNVDRSIDVNIHLQKTPYVIKCSEKQRLTFKNLFMKVFGFQPLVFANKNLDLDGIQSIPLNAPFISDKLQLAKSDIWNEALTHLGVPNISIQKKERMIQDEVMRSQGGAIASRFSRLIMREEACKLINKMFGLDISVEYRLEFLEQYKMDSGVI